MKAASSNFQLQKNANAFNSDLDLQCDDLLHNFTTKDSQLMKGSIPWRGAREKDPKFVQILLEACTRPGDLVMDYNASTGVF